MNTTVECQVLFHQFVDFISQNNNVSIREIKAAGADTFVAGSAIFGKPNYRDTIDQMRSELAQAE